MKYLSENEQRSLLRVLKDSRSATRDRTIIEFVLHTGLRLREVQLLNVSDIWDGVGLRATLIVRGETAKRGREREVFLNSHVSEILGVFIRWKRSEGESLDAQSPLLVSKKKGRISPRSLQEMAEKWFVRAGLVDAEGHARYSFHSLRHSLAMNLRRREVGLERIQRVMGHKSLASTGVYIQPSKEDLELAMEMLAA